VNRQLFLQLLEHPDSASETEHLALKKFTEDFPYCQTGRLLFVKHLHSQKSVHYPEQLKIAAAYAADRKVLYNLVHTLTSPQPATAEPAQWKPGLAPLERKEDSIPVEHEEEKNSFTQSTSVDQREEHVEERTEQIPLDIIPGKKIVEEPESQADIIQKRLQEIAALKASPLQTRWEPPTESVEEKISEPEIIPEKETGAVAPKEIEVSHDKKEDTKSGKHSFTEWLKTVKREPAKPAGQEKSAPPASSSNEIIDRFIETEPRIVPSKTEFYNPVKMAKQSLEEHDDLISETLAGIFAEQGNLPRAIEMYRKLMLSYPEKSSFFATLVEKLTQQLNEGK
jgi:hypothetical protein